MKKTIIICSIILSALICAGFAASAALGAAAMKKSEAVRADVGDLRSAVNEFAARAGGMDVAQENGVTIAGEYVIKSTENISDAYKSGKTDGLSDKEKETLDMASEILAGIIEDGMDDYEKEVAVYKWMTENLESDEGMLIVIPQTQADCDNPYGVLKYHNAVCVGYATTFRLLMQMLDIPCKVVHNSEMYHSWDLVNLGDSWYHTDIYSDVGLGNFAHFNLTDEMMGEQNWNRDYFPAADSYEYCYIYREAVETDDIYTIPANLRELIDGERDMAAFVFKGGLSNSDAALVEEMLNTLSSLVGSGSGEYDYASLNWNWSAAGSDYLLSVSYNTETWDDPDDPVAIDEGDRKKMKKSIVDAFGDLYEIDMDDDDWYGGSSYYYGSYDYSWDGQMVIPTDEEFEMLTEAYRNYLVDAGAVTVEEAASVDPDNWYGTFGGMQVLMFNRDVTAEGEREEMVAGNAVNFSDGRGIVVTDGTNFYSLAKAFEYGVLDGRQVRMIAEIQNNGYYMEVDG